MFFVEAVPTGGPGDGFGRPQRETIAKTIAQEIMNDEHQCAQNRYTPFCRAALLAVKMIRNGEIAASNPREAWTSVLTDLGAARAVIDKGCPKSAFLGLCETGRVDGVPAGAYTRSRANKQYALTATKNLKERKDRGEPPLPQRELWIAVMRDLGQDPISHNGQMDVVLCLWLQGLIDPRDL